MIRIKIYVSDTRQYDAYANEIGVFRLLTGRLHLNKLVIAVSDAQRGGSRDGVYAV